MSEDTKVRPFFVNQEVVVNHAITVTRNIYIEVDSRSFITTPTHIEELLTVGTKGQVLDYTPDAVLLYFFPHTNSAIRIWVKRVHFGTRFDATNNVVW